MAAIETRTPSDIAKTIFERLNHRDLEGTAEFACEDVDEYWPVVGRLQGVPACVLTLQRYSRRCPTSRSTLNAWLPMARRFSYTGI